MPLDLSGASTYLDSAGGGYSIRSALGYYLDIANASTSNGTNVRVWTGNRTNAQKFKFVAVASSTNSTYVHPMKDFQAKGKAARCMVGTLIVAEIVIPNSARNALPHSLEYAVSQTPTGAWMNNIPSYSMWWIIIQHDYYMQYGNRDYLQKQLPYLKQVCRMLSEHIGEDGKDTTPEMRFVDWNIREDKAATDIGLQALHVLATRCAALIFEVFEETEMYIRCCIDLEKLNRYQVYMSDAKQANALAVWAGLMDAEQVNKKSLNIDGVKGLSAFMGYYILQARAQAGDVAGALDIIREYWGGMLKLGATTFWEDFDVDWLKNAAPIDRFPEDYEVDVHGAYGKHCYQGFRHSLCHGWSSGPTSWLTRYVLGVEVMEPGCRKIRVTPNLCGLQWVKGTYPTPEGILEIEHRVVENGDVESLIHAPQGIVVICDSRIN